MEFFSSTSPFQPPIQWVPGVKSAGLEAYRSQPSRNEVKNAWSCALMFSKRRRGVQN
jgi:hypothetical protein